MSKFTELSVKDINEVNGGSISPYVVTTGPAIAPYITKILIGAGLGVAYHYLKK